MENEQTTKKNPHIVNSLYFKTATDAKKHAERIIARWRRLYDAWVMVESEKSEVLLNG